MSIELKIKSKHLSQEAKIIRCEENKLKAQKQWFKDNEKTNTPEYDKICGGWFILNEHRRTIVRQENRATFLARAYLSGKAYSTVEQKRKEEKEWQFQSVVIPRVVTMVNKYGSNNVTKDAIREWLRT